MKPDLMVHSVVIIPAQIVNQCSMKYIAFWAALALAAASRTAWALASYIPEIIDLPTASYLAQLTIFCGVEDRASAATSTKHKRISGDTQCVAWTFFRSSVTAYRVYPEKTWHPLSVNAPTTTG